MYNCLLVASFYIQESCFCEFGTFVNYYVQEGEFSVCSCVNLIVECMWLIWHNHKAL